MKIRELTIEDAEKIRIWRNKQTKVLRQNNLINFDDQQEYFKLNVLPEYYKEIPTQYLLGIVKNQVLIGYGGLVYIDFLKKKAELSFLVDNKIDNESKLYEEIFTFFINSISKIAKNKFNLESLYTETHEFRTKHIAILEKNKFVNKGIANTSIQKDNLEFDSILHIRKTS